MSSTSRFEYDQMRMRTEFARNRGKANPLAALPNEVLARESKVQIGQEIKSLHVPFEQWLNCNEITFVHSNPTAKVTIHVGTPDFICMANGLGCCIEFKALAEPQRGLSEAQEGWIYRAQKRGVPCLVSNDLAQGIEFARKHLNL
jgi:hypothetical protein